MRTFGWTVSRWLMVAGLAGLAACEDGAGLTASQPIGPAGGAITLGPATLTIPAGALPEEVEISVTEVSPPDSDGNLAPLYLFEPEGTQFAQPFTFEVALAAVPRDPVLALWVTGDTVERIEPVVEGADVQVRGTHFSSLTLSTERCGDGVREDAGFICRRARREGIHYVCVDLVRYAYEECDDGNRVTESCPAGTSGTCQVCGADCRFVTVKGPTCGDGVVDDGEACDDGNQVTETCPTAQPCTVCGAACQLVPGGSACGNGVVDPGEGCDDGNTVTEVCAYGAPACQVCSSDCQLVAGQTSSCGDGAIEGPEGCDDGNTVTEACPYGQTCAVCGATCTVTAGVESRCGDSVTNGPEDCDDGNAITEVCPYGQACTTCTATCTTGPGAQRYCGDSIVSGPEDCDDGNATTEACAYGATSCNVCRSDCTTGPGIVTGYCGDGVKNGPELCDGADLGGDTCQTIGYVSGTLACSGSCTLDATGCSNIAAPRALSASSNGYCAILPDGRVACFGRNDYGVMMAPTGTFKDVSVGLQQACAIRADDTLVCWGSGPAASGVPAGTFKRLSVGEKHACAIATDDSLTCWGDNYFGQSAAQAGTFLDVSAGYDKTCAVRGDGTAYCWGQNAISPLQTDHFKSVVLENSTYCLIALDDTAVCYGVSAPTPPAGVTFKKLGGFPVSFCGIRFDNTLSCWGTDGALIQGLVGATPIVSFAVMGSGAVCVQTIQDAYACYGGNSTQPFGPTLQALHAALAPSNGASPGELGGFAVLSTGALAGWGYLGAHLPAPGGTWRQVTTGVDGACGITSSGAIQCWGAAASVTPVAPAGTDFVRVEISRNGDIGCGLHADGAFECFKAPTSGTLAALPTGPGYLAVDIGTLNVCAIDGAGALACYETTAYAPPPPATGTYTALSLESDWGCAIDSAGDAVCFGGGFSDTPPAGPFTDVAVGDAHACGLRTDGTIACWKKLSSYVMPAQLAVPSGTYTKVMVGAYEACGLRSDGRLTCWGDFARTP